MQVWCPRDVGAAAGKAGLRWRADLAFAANESEAVGEELQPVGSVWQGRREAQKKRREFDGGVTG